MTPFGRQPVTAGLLATRALAEAPAPAATADKWALLRDLTQARKAIGVSDRDLAVLSALLSFHPGKDLADDDGLIVFPSNRSLSDRAHGMPESTLRRHIAALCRAGLILRRDSPNGKRYATRDCSGALDRAYGFDLRPLLVRSAEISDAARQARQDALRRHRLREMTVIRLRDAAKLLVWASENDLGDCADGLEAIAGMQKQLRRKLDLDSLQRLADCAARLLARIHDHLPRKTEDMSGNDSQNERHHQNSNTEPLESESCKEQNDSDLPGSDETPPMPLEIVLKATPDIRDYTSGDIRSWRDLVRVAAFVSPMLGITPDAWRQACQEMGAAAAATTLACILQRSGSIARPGGYLRHLTDKAANKAFSPGPMVMALLRADNRLAA
ncbi:replication initiation protein RepC [Paracoccus halophilus]|nr:replication initiation protein RepC [Paracoccus halophilus]